MSDQARQIIRARQPAMWERAKTGSRKAAIRLACLECMGGVQSEVARCTDRECPLYRYRMRGRAMGSACTQGHRDALASVGAENLTKAAFLVAVATLRSRCTLMRPVPHDGCGPELHP